MDLRHFRYFVAVAEELNFTRAARRLHISQPPLSQHIQAMEQELGTRLFERSRGHVALTHAGSVLLLEARKVLAQAEHALAETRRAALGEGGVLSLGYGAWAPYSPIFASTLRIFREENPLVELALQVGRTDDIIARTCNGDLQVGLVRPRDGLPLPAELDAVAVCSEALMLVVSPGHALADRPEPVPLADVAPYPFVLGISDSGHGVYGQVLAACRDAGFEPQVAQRSNNADTILALVNEGMGIAILPESLRPLGMAPLRWLRLSARTSLTSSVYALTHGRRFGTPQRERFMAVLRAGIAGDRIRD